MARRVHTHNEGQDWGLGPIRVSGVFRGLSRWLEKGRQDLGPLVIIDERGLRNALLDAVKITNYLILESSIQGTVPCQWYSGTSSKYMSHTHSSTFIQSPSFSIISINSVSHALDSLSLSTFPFPKISQHYNMHIQRCWLSTILACDLRCQWFCCIVSRRGLSHRRGVSQLGNDEHNRRIFAQNCGKISFHLDRSVQRHGDEFQEWIFWMWTREQNWWKVSSLRAWEDFFYRVLGKVTAVIASCFRLIWEYLRQSFDEAEKISPDRLNICDQNTHINPTTWIM